MPDIASPAGAACPQDDALDDVLVSVVIPAFQAADTLRETLESACAQTHGSFEIIVVDDGSTDETEAIARDVARRDPRIRVLRMPNGGVAAARNAAIAAARGDFIAPLDADDLWHPDKISRQLRELCRGGTSMAFVYSGSRRIDTAGLSVGDFSFRDCRGPAFLRSLLVNFAGNGSSVLARRSALEAVGGYSPELRENGVEGTEDWLVQTLMARDGTVGAVPAALTGYRLRDGAMSSDRERMFRSQLTAVEIAVREHPETPHWAVEAAKARVEIQMSILLLRLRRFREAASTALSGLRRSPLFACLAGCERARVALRRARRRRPCQRHFGALDPDEAPTRVPYWDPLAVMLRRLARAEATLPPRGPAVPCSAEDPDLHGRGTVADRRPAQNPARVPWGAASATRHRPTPAGARCRAGTLRPGAPDA